MNVIWNGPIFEPSGYGKAARDYVMALNEFTNVYIDPVRYFVDSKFDYITNNIPVSGLVSNAVHVEHKTPDILTRAGYDKNIGYTVWETLEAPSRFRVPLNYKDEIWTCSEFSKKSLEASGTTTPIHVVSHIINKPENTEPIYHSKFTFFFNGEFTSRKGIDILLSAYYRLFKHNKNVRLILKTYILNQHKHKDYISNSINHLRRFFGITSDYPEVKVISEVLPESSLDRLYRMSDVFITATRGEGFGLPIAEAQSYGLVTIVPDKGGHMDFCSSKTSLLVESEYVDVDPKKLEEERSVYLGQKWIETDEEALMSAMETAYRNYDYIKILGENTFRRFDNLNYAKEKVQKVIKERLDV